MSSEDRIVVEEPKEKPEKSKRILQIQDLPLPRRLIHTIEQFISDLESIKEMFEVVIPVLKQKDELRKNQINELFSSLDSFLKNDDNQDDNEKKEKFVLELIELLPTLRKLNRADLMFRQNALVMLVSRYDEFLADVLEIIFRANPDRLKSVDKTLTYEEILQLGSIEEALTKFVSKEVDKILREAHADHIRYIDKQLKLNIEQQIIYWPDLIELTERRNLFVHTGGRVSQQYIRACKSNNIKLEPKIEENKILSVNEEYFKNAYKCLFEIGIKVSQSVYRKLFPNELAEAEHSLNLTIGIRLLEREQWELANIVFDYALSIPVKLLFSDYDHKVYTINKCIALKWSGAEDKMNELLDSIDWGAYHPKFLLAVRVLKDEYDEAENIMTKMGDQYILEGEYKGWPLFRDFRRSEQFRRAFKSIFKKDYQVEILEDAILLAEQEHEILVEADGEVVTNIEKPMEVEELK